MKSMLTQFAFRKALGVYVGEREVVVCKLASAPGIVVQQAMEREPYVADQLEEVLQRLIAPLLGKKRRIPLPVGLGLAGQRVFFSTRPIKATNAESSPEMLLHEAFQSASISVDDMALDVVKVKPEKKPVASIASCRRKYLASLLVALRSADVNPHRAEPAPCALLRVAAAQFKPPRKAKTVVRLFLSGEQAIAILAVSNLPYVWRYFNLRIGEESNAILAAVRTLQTLSKPCGLEGPIDAVMIHGRNELRQQLNFDSLQEDLGIPAVWHAGPTFDDATIAYGLALGCLSQAPESFDLAKSLKPRRTLWELFPWSESVVQAVLIVFMGLFLAERSSSLNQSYASVKREIGEHVWMETVSEAELEKERKELESKVDAIRKFMGTRILWTSYAHDIPMRLPKNAVLSGLEGLCDLEMLGKKKESAIKSKKSFLIRVNAPIEHLKMPKEIDNFLNALKEHPLLKKDFPNVQFTELKRYQPFNGAKPIAMFAVNCMPRDSAPAPAPAPEKKE